MNSSLDFHDLKNIKALLLDLDGTLLDIDLNKFVPQYFKKLGQYFESYCNPELVIKYILQGCDLIAKTYSERTCSQVFLDYFCEKLGQPHDRVNNRFKDFYSNIYPTLKDYVKDRPESIELIKIARQKNMKVVLSTNPLFLIEGIRARMSWANLTENMFDLVTSIENSHTCKPNLGYYQEITQKIGFKPSECLVVGDEIDDIVASKLGCHTYLVESPMTILDSNSPMPTFKGSIGTLCELLKNYSCAGGESEYHQNHPDYQNYPNHQNHKNHEDLIQVQGEENRSKIIRMASTLASAFEDYPLYKSVFPNNETRLNILQSFQTMLTRFGDLFGHIIISSSNYEGVLVHVHSSVDLDPLADWRWVRSGYGGMASDFGNENLDRMMKVSKIIEGQRKKHTNFPHEYIMTLGVQPNMQNKGVGRTLLQFLLIFLDENQLPCYLETFKAKNVEIYSKYGFQLIDSYQIPEYNLTLYSMLRSIHQK